ncbi:MAG: nucleotidyltransferase domain-containing protein [Thermodesulfobacteriota bacterium]|nr:nucleotidyltransferase domain-containing protein [Thermodesulfobacteriota bacterium]
MDKRKVIEIVGRFHQKIQALGIRPQKIILYGSYAAGNAASDSDIDIVVISDDFVGKGYWERIDILADVIYDLFEPIEAVAMTCEEWERGDSVITQYASNGEVLFAA